jgi:hypothetical protein
MKLTQQNSKFNLFKSKVDVCGILWITNFEILSMQNFFLPRITKQKSHQLNRTQGQPFLVIMSFIGRTLKILTFEILSMQNFSLTQNCQTKVS